MEHNLQKFLKEHFFYEVEMLIYSAQKLFEANQKNDTPGINMGLETFLLHSRNLIEFFYFDKNKNKEYARAVDFINPKKWNLVRPQRDESINKFLERANYEVSHLTYKRLYGETDDKKWIWGEYLLKLLGITRAFLDNLSPEYRDTMLEILGQQVDHNMQRLRLAVK